MPRRYRRKKKTAPRRRRRRTKVSSNPFTKVGQQVAPSGMPTKRVAKLRYSTVVGMGNAVGVVNNYVFRANSGFDPDWSGSGHQPMGWDTWTSLYNEYVVIGSRINVRWKQSLVGTYAGVFLSASPTLGYTTASEMIEAQKGTTRLLSPQREAGRSFATYSAKKFYNIKDIKDNTDRLGASTGANPAEGAYFQIWSQAADSSSEFSLLADVLIEYIILFSEPKQLAQS